MLAGQQAAGATDRNELLAGQQAAEQQQQQLEACADEQVLAIQQAAGDVDGSKLLEGQQAAEQQLQQPPVDASADEEVLARQQAADSAACSSELLAGQQAAGDIDGSKLLAGQQAAEQQQQQLEKKRHGRVTYAMMEQWQQQLHELAVCRNSPSSAVDDQLAAAALDAGGCHVRAAKGVLPHAVDVQVDACSNQLFRLSSDGGKAAAAAAEPYAVHQMQPAAALHLLFGKHTVAAPPCSYLKLDASSQCAQAAAASAASGQGSKPAGKHSTLQVKPQPADNDTAASDATPASAVEAAMQPPHLAVTPGPPAAAAQGITTQTTSSSWLRCALVKLLSCGSSRSLREVQA
jgi:hypothetical protein